MVQLQNQTLQCCMFLFAFWVAFYVKRKRFRIMLSSLAATSPSKIIKSHYLAAIHSCYRQTDDDSSPHFARKCKTIAGKRNFNHLIHVRISQVREVH